MIIYFLPLVQFALWRSLLLSPNPKLACSFVLWLLRCIRQFPGKDKGVFKMAKSYDFVDLPVPYC